MDDNKTTPSLQQLDASNLMKPEPDGSSSGYNSTSDLTTYNRPPQTIVSFVIDEHKQGSDQKTTEDCHGPRQLPQVLSGIYTVLVILVGVAFPVTEAIRDSWRTEIIVGIFLVYLFGFSSIFLLYLQYFNLHKGSNPKHDHRETETNNKHIQPRNGDVIFSKRGPKSVISGASSDALDEMKELENGASGNIPTIERKSVETDESKFQQEDNYNHHENVVNNDITVANNDITVAPGIRRRGGTLDDSRSQMTDTDNQFDDMETIEKYIILNHQTASLAHEGTSFYLRLGAVLFGIGNLIYVALEIEYVLNYHIPPNCPRRVAWPMFFHLVFILVQTFFLFKFSQVNVKKHKGFVRFGFMHVLTTNFCIWIRILVRETMEGAHHVHSAASSFELEYSLNESSYYAFAPSNDIIYGSESSNSSCVDDESLLKKAAPYLFPCVLEYSLIAVATMYSMASSTDVKCTRDLVQTIKKHLKRKYQEKKERVLEEAQMKHTGVDFDKSHRGLFLGMIFLSGIMVSIAMFFFYSRRDSDKASFIYFGTYLAACTAVLIGIVVAVIRMYNLAFDSSRPNSIDNYLLVVSMSGLFLYDMFAILCISSLMVNGEIQGKMGVYSIQLVSCIVSSAQAIVQTVFIIDGMQRYSETQEDRDKKAGRGSVTFLIIANIAMWLFQTLQVKEVKEYAQHLFFGALAWNLILHLCLPLILFFRFHSSVCLADIWSSAYSEEHMEESVFT